MSDEKQLVAWVEIFNYEHNIKIETIEEPTSSEDNAKEEFEKLNNMISHYNSPEQGFVFSTTMGTTRLSSKFLSSSWIVLKFGYAPIH